jgi:competence protein ComEA
MNFDDIRDRLPEFSPLQVRALLMLGGVGLLLSTFFFLLSRGHTEEISQPLPAPTISIATTSLFVDVAGKVIHPGVYQLPQGSRAIDAITMAGGAKSGIDLSDINLAHILIDGEQLYVGGIYVGGSVSSGGTRRGKININRASKSEFDSLPGIGPVLATRIITYRTKNGPFASVEDLQKVSGIGGSKFDDIKDFLRI